MKQILSLLVLFLALQSSVAQKKFLPSEKNYDVRYGSFPSSQLDVYLPVNRNKQTPFVIIIHGGGWVGGDKKSDRGSQQILMEQGIASANINYRFVDSLDTHFPEMLADIDSAVQYCVNNADAWNTRKKNFVFMGASAGGHLSLLYSYTTNRKIKAIISECSPVDLTDTATLTHETSIGLLHVINKMAGAIYVPGKPIDPKFFASSPIYHVKDIPTLIVHGTKDKIVPYIQALKLESKLKA